MVEPQHIVASSRGTVEVQAQQTFAVLGTIEVVAATVVKDPNTGVRRLVLRSRVRTQHLHWRLHRNRELLTPVVPHFECARPGIEFESQVDRPAVRYLAPRPDLRLRRPAVVSGSGDEHHAGMIRADRVVDLSTEAARAVGRSANGSEIEQNHHRHREFARLGYGEVDRDGKGRRVVEVGFVRPFARDDLCRDDRGPWCDASVLRIDAVAAVPGGNARRRGAMTNGVPRRQGGAGGQRVVYLLAGVNGAASVGVIRVPGARVVREVEDVSDSSRAVVVSKVAALPVDAAVEDCDDDALSGEAQRDCGLVDARFRTNPVDGESDVSGDDGKAEGNCMARAGCHVSNAP